MALREITIDGQPLLVEVADLKVEGQAAGDGREYTALPAPLGDLKDRLDPLLKTLAAPVKAAFEAAGAAEWTLELSIGFKAGTGVPFIAAGEANAAVKVTAKWTRAA